MPISEFFFKFMITLALILSVVNFFSSPKDIDNTVKYQFINENTRVNLVTGSREVYSNYFGKWEYK
jgi:hypothetical protein